MGLVACPDCGNMISDIAAVCPKCGRPISHVRIVRVLVVLALMLAAIIVAIGLILINEPDVRRPARPAPRGAVQR